jgi:hypothetical protein
MMGARDFIVPRTTPEEATGGKRHCAVSLKKIKIRAFDFLRFSLAAFDFFER